MPRSTRAGDPFKERPRKAHQLRTNPRPRHGQRQQHRDQLRHERQRLVLNQNYRNFAGNLTQTEIEERLMREFHYVFPYQKKLLTCANLGEPYVLQATRYFGFGRSAHLLVGEIERLADRSVAAEIDHLAKMINEEPA